MNDNKRNATPDQSTDEQCLARLEALFDEWDYLETRSDRPLSAAGKELSDDQARAICLDALLNRRNEEIALLALDLLSARPSVESLDIVVAALNDDRTSTEDIHLLSLIADERTVPHSAFFYFIAPKRRHWFDRPAHEQFSYKESRLTLLRSRQHLKLKATQSRASISAQPCSP